MKRIFYIAFNRLPTEKAHGLQIVKTCEALALGGAEVELVVPKRKNTISTDIFSYYGSKKNFKLTEVRGVDLVRFGSLGFFISLVIFSEMAHWSKRFWKADIVYSRDAVVLLQFILLGRPLVYEAHQKPSGLRTFVAQRSVKLVVISNALKQAYQNSGVASEKIIVAPDAVELERFVLTESKETLRKHLGLPLDKKIVLYAGHLYPRKGAHVLAEAVKEMSDVHTVFVGGTPDDVHDFQKRFSGVSSIHILGHRPPDQIPSFLKAADVVVLPASAKDDDTKLYASPMKLFEYCASGTPLVVSDVPSVREILGDDEAFFVEPDSPQVLRGGLEKALENPERAGVVAEKARKVAEKNTWSERARTVLLSLP